MAQQTKRFSQQLLAGSQKGAWWGHETNPKSKSVLLQLLLLLLLLRCCLAVCPMSCVIVLPLLLVLGNSVVSFICARIDFYATFFWFFSSSQSLSLSLSWLCSCWLFHAHNWKFNWFTKWSRFWAIASHCALCALFLPFTLSPFISLSLFFLVFYLFSFWFLRAEQQFLSCSRVLLKASVNSCWPFCRSALW